MATFEDGINGPFRGKVGSVIGSKWRKINYMKGLPEIKETRAPSPGQALTRTKFKLLNRFLEPLSQILEISFRQFTAEATGRNMAFSYNYDEAFIVEGEKVRLNYPALRFSHGSLVAAGAERAWVDDGVLHVSWNTKTYGMGGSPDDETQVLLFNEVKSAFYKPDAHVERQDGQTQLTQLGHAITAPEHCHVWLFFIDSDKKRASKTVYIPIGEAPEN